MRKGEQVANRERERGRERERKNTVKQSDTKRKEIEGERDIWYIIHFLYIFFLNVN